MNQKRVSTLSAMLYCVALFLLPALLVAQTPPWPMHGHDAKHTARSAVSGNTELNTALDNPQIISLGANAMYSPVIGPNNEVYLVTVGSGSIYQIHKFDSNGSEITGGNWPISPPNTSDEIRSAPAIASDGTLYVVWDRPLAQEGLLYAYNPNGSAKWATPYALGVGTPSSSLVVDTFDAVYINGFPDGIQVINADKSPKCTISNIDAYKIPVIGDDGSIYVPGGHDVFGSYDGGFSAYTSNCSPKWSKDYSGSSSNLSLFTSPVIASNGLVYTARWFQQTPNNYTLLALNPDDGSIVCQLNVPSSWTPTGCSWRSARTIRLCLPPPTIT